MEWKHGVRSRRRLLFGAALGAALVLAAVAGVEAARTGRVAPSRKKAGPEPVPAAPVELSQVRRGSIVTSLQSTTTLEPRNAATIVAQRQGQVMALQAEEGQWVRAGEVLARLDDRDAELAVQRTELAAEAARRDAERGQQMKARDYLSQRELDELEVRRREAWVALEQARLDLSRTRIVAPFAGRIVSRLVNLGETVLPGRECFRILDFNPVLARVYFPEREIGKVAVGQRAWVTLEPHPDDPIPARVWLVNPVVDQTNGTFKVTLEIPNARDALRPGALARVRVETAHITGALLMPRRGVLNEDGEPFVFVARGDSAVRVAVHLGAVDRDTVQVLDGLAAGDRVVTVGHGGLRPGARIRPVTL